MHELRLHPNMLIGVTLPAAGASRTVAESERELRLLRKLAVRCCAVECDWAALERTPGRFDDESFEALRWQLLGLRTLGVEPLLCLWHGREPRWFTERGGWSRGGESILRYRRYASEVVTRLGHLCAEYVTFAEPGSLLGGRLPSGGKALSALAGAHLAAYKLIHSQRRQRGYRDTAVGFALQPRRSGAERGVYRLLDDAFDPALHYQQLLLRVMARCEFARPFRNIGGAESGIYCDFQGLSCGADTGLLARKSTRELGPEDLSEYCARLLRVVARPLYLVDGGVYDWDDSYRSRYIYEHLRSICQSHEPVLRYYYNGLLDSDARHEGLAATRGLFYLDGEGKEHIKPSGAFFAALNREAGVSEELYQQYVAGKGKK